MSDFFPSRSLPGACPLRREQRLVLSQQRLAVLRGRLPGAILSSPPDHVLDPGTPTPQHQRHDTSPKSHTHHDPNDDLHTNEDRRGV